MLFFAAESIARDTPLNPTMLQDVTVVKSKPLKGPNPAATADAEVDTDTETLKNLAAVGPWFIHISGILYSFHSAHRQPLKS
jgi:hypothetical protein